MMSVLNKVVIPRTRELQRLGLVEDVVGSFVVALLTPTTTYPPRKVRVVKFIAELGRRRITSGQLQT